MLIQNFSLYPCQFSPKSIQEIKKRSFVVYFWPLNPFISGYKLDPQFLNCFLQKKKLKIPLCP